ncbi:MAG: hypothetical protein ABGZ49_10135 [Akkermansiaceae bacterium]|nr:hypothetical protein [Roseibacillus sp.]
MFKRTKVGILGTELNGFDPHGNQGSSYGSHGNILQDLAFLEQRGRTPAGILQI